MTEAQILKTKAEHAAAMCQSGRMTYDEAKKEIQPWVNHFNTKAREIAKKFKRSPMLITVEGVMR